MTADDLRKKYIDFFVEKGHKEIPSSPLVPENDPTVLFTTAGMHPLVPYLLGEPHPLGKRLVSVQKCLRTDDIDDVGDSTHHTFFEMLGNWSLGDYFKKESIAWSFEFLTKHLKIEAERLFISVFSGDNDAPKDEESAEIWESLGIPKDRIYFLPKKDNWWGPAGNTGPCGPDTEIYYDTKNPSCGKACRPGCINNCGKYVEIWNNVFMQYNKTPEGKYIPLKQKNVDTGMGVERTITILQGKNDVYETDLFIKIINTIEKLLNIQYKDENKRPIRIIADHIKAATFLIKDGVIPGNKERGYILRRLIRRAGVKIYGLTDGKLTADTVKEISKSVINTYCPIYFKKDEDEKTISPVLSEEINKFSKTLTKGLQEMKKYQTLDGKIAFDLYQSYGFPLEITTELAVQKGQSINKEIFKKEFEKHQQLSRSSSIGMFKGGLSDASKETTKLHTATHLLHQALRLVLGESVAQKGSNITKERLRFDFNHPQKLSAEELKKVEDLVNEKIKENLPVECKIVTLNEAKKEGAMALFTQKYEENVKLYKIGDFSKEVCGGPHVSFTGSLKCFKIIKEESAGSGIRRIYGKVS